MNHTLPLLYDYVFPNYIVPNACPVEQTIINYIHTRYNSGRNGDIFLETHLETDKSPLNMIFGKEMYDSWPTSLLHGGSRLKNHCYHGLLDIEEQSVYFGKIKYEKYIYPIKVGPHFDAFVGQTHHRNKLNGESFWKNISAETLCDAIAGNAFIFLDWGEENYITREQYECLHSSIERSGIPKSQIILAYNSFNAKEIYDSWFPESEQRLTVMNWPYSLFYTSWHYATKPQIRMNEDMFKASRDTIRPNHYLFRTRRARGHRIALIAKLASDDLLDRGDWSFLDNISLTHTLRTAQEFYKLDVDEEKVTNLHKKFPHRLQMETDSHFNNIGGWSDLVPEHNMNAYFDVTTETFTDIEQESLTEKVCKPLVNFQPFLFMAFPGALALLRANGFKTFSPFIDESYDQEKDEVKRLHMVYSEIKRLSSMSKEEIHDWYWQMEDILIHNHYAFLDFHKNDTINQNLIKYLLTNCVKLRA